jgi:para-nitrobenzyl esterase
MQFAARSTCLMPAVCAICSSAAADFTTVQTSSGPVRGAATDIVTFKGVPYAAAPIGERRWRPPVAPAAWTEVRDATRFGL